MPEETSTPPPIPSASTAPAGVALNLPVVPDAAVDPKKLTPEEQMALFEKDLKENDWGHQPC